MPDKLIRLTVPKFVALKSAGRKICMVTAYDHTMGQLVDEAGVDAVLVGDSLSTVVGGHETTLPVTLEQMLYHAEMVGRAVRRALVIVDLPFPFGHLGPRQAVEAAARVLKETHCQAVKLEGGRDQAEVIAALHSAGIPVMAHCGLRPQTVHQLGGYKVQRQEERLIAEAESAVEAGAFGVLLECIPAKLASVISQRVAVPTIGIGAGAGCDGQVLVTPDLLGLSAGHIPRFVRKYADLSGTITDALRRYCDDVRRGDFPGPDESYA